LAYDGERSDAPVLDQLETILRHVADELALWRARAVKAEAELKESGGAGRGSPVKLDPETRVRVADLEQENKTLETLLSAPVNRRTIVAAKLVGAGLVALAFALVYMIGFRYYMNGMSGGAISTTSTSFTVIPSFASILIRNR